MNNTKLELPENIEAKIFSECKKETHTIHIFDAGSKESGDSENDN